MNIFNKTKTDHSIKKNFSYTRNKVGLNFTLRVDVKHELKDFLELLKEAQKEVEKELCQE